MAYIMKNEIEISRLAAASCWLWWLRRKKEIASFSFHLALSLSLLLRVLADFLIPIQLLLIRRPGSIGSYAATIIIHI